MKQDITLISLLASIAITVLSSSAPPKKKFGGDKEENEDGKTNEETSKLEYQGFRLTTKGQTYEVTEKDTLNSLDQKFEIFVHNNIL